MTSSVKKFLLNLFFPKFCFGCQKEGSYLCEDCKSILSILQEHQKYSGKQLKDLYWALPYQGFLIKNLIQSFKYEPFTKELSKTLSLLIINHFQLIENPPSFFEGSSGFVLIPVPLHKKRLKWRGFNQAEAISKKLSSFLKISLFSDCLIKIRETLPQVELLEKEREKNVLGSFLINPVRKEWRIWNPVRKRWFSNGVKNKEKIRKKKILLIDDVYTTGATMKECARVLKEAGAKEIIGIVVARG